jgi:hypothetical protein
MYPMYTVYCVKHIDKYDNFKLLLQKSYQNMRFKPKTNPQIKPPVSIKSNAFYQVIFCLIIMKYESI